MEKDLKWIKKHYGEKMMHLCRENFYKILEQEGLLPKLLQNHFFQQKDLADDIIEQNKIVNFKDYIFSFVNVEGSKPKEIIKKSAVQLMDEAGYILYPECKTEKDIQSFRKYWAKNEELCTFRGGRLNSCRVWFAVKKDCENIKRKNFFNPRRQDEYGTSVISIQFAKNNSQTLSIKNRYNHTVNNPDNTFNSNLDNIIPGLTDAFYQDYGVKDRIDKYKEFELIDYVFARGMYFKYNYEIDNIYYCPNNVLIKDFTPMRLSQHNILLDYFAFNIKNKTVSSIYKSDSFLDGFSDIESMEVKNNTLTIKMKDKKDAIITFDNRRRITGYCNENLTECGDNFLCYNKVLTDLTLPNLTKCGWGFLGYNEALTNLILPNLTESGGSFLCFNKALTNLNLPKLTRCQYMFLYNNEALKNLSLPNLTVCGWDFLYSNKDLTNLSLPKLTRCGDNFLYSNEELKNLSLPNLTE